jgi:SOS-response transcriptional repressor LexA
LPASVIPIGGTREGMYAVLEACLPGKLPRNIGVLIMDPESNRAWTRFRESFDDIAEPDDAEVLAGLEEHFQAVIASAGAGAWMAYLEDSLSNTVRIAEQASVRVDAFTRALDQLFDKHVQRMEPQPYKTHLPMFSMRAAAGFIGDEMRPEEEDWVRAPEGMRLDKDLVVVHVVGRSMEPRIPDGSLNIFRLNPVGSRQNRILLIQRRGVLDDTAGCTVKRYTSVKAQTGEDEWHHERIRLEPLNPEFEPWDVGPEGFDVIAEWVRVIE